MKTPAIETPPICFPFKTCPPSQGSQDQGACLPSGLSGEVPKWQDSGWRTLWCLPLIPEQSFGLIKLLPLQILAAGLDFDAGFWH